MKLIAFAVLAQFITLTTAFTIRGSIPPTQLLPNPATLSADTQITLTTSGARKSALLRTDNTFVFRNISEGSYILDTSCPTYHFAPLRVDVSRSGDVTVHQTFRGNPWSNLGEARGHPIELRPIKAVEYLVVREGFNALKMLSSPMLLIGIVGFASVVFLPKLMDKLDPEFKAELEAQQRNTPAAAAANPMANFDMASFLAGTSSSSRPAVAPAQGHGKRKG